MEQRSDNGDGPGGPDAKSEWERFLDLTRRLVKIPKRDVDAARQREEAEKAEPRG